MILKKSHGTFNFSTFYLNPILLWRYLEIMFRLFSFIFFYFLISSAALFSGEKGTVIAFAGVSGAGKTTMAKSLASLCSCHCLVEPEEADWPEVIRKADVFGNFTWCMAFRQLWLPQQYEAQDLKNKGQNVILDTFFIKIVGYELEAPDLDWLFPKDNPYFQAFYQVCELDIEYLPDPDCIVLFDVSFEDWLKLLSIRNRDLDKRPGFIESYQPTKTAINNAVFRLCEERNIRLIHFKQEFGDVGQQALRLKSILIEANIL